MIIKIILPIFGLLFLAAFAGLMYTFSEISDWINNYGNDEPEKPEDE